MGTLSHDRQGAGGRLRSLTVAALTACGYGTRDSGAAPFGTTEPAWTPSRNELTVFDLGDLEGDTGLDADDLVVWGELLAGQGIHKGSGVTNLAAEEWLERWRAFRRRHPAHPPLP